MVRDRRNRVLEDLPLIDPMHNRDGGANTFVTAAGSVIRVEKMNTCGCGGTLVEELANG